MEDPVRGAHPHPPDIVNDMHDVHVAERNGRQMSSGSWVCCMPCYWLRTNSSLHKASLTIVTLLVTSLLVASPVLFLISSVPASEQPYKDCINYEDDECFIEKIFDVPTSVCETPMCIDIARRLRYSLSWDHDACKDFYNFACGGRTNSLKADAKRSNTLLGVDLSFSTIQTKVHLLIQHLINLNGNIGRFKKIGEFFSSCMNALEKPIDMVKMYQVLDQLGGYLPPGSLGPKDITPLVINILKVSGAPLFDISLTADMRNRSNPAIMIDLPNDYPNMQTMNNEDNQFLYFDHWRSNRMFSYDFPSGRRKREIRKESVHYTYLKGKHLEKKLFNLESIVLGMLPRGMPVSRKTTEIQQILLFATAVEQLLPRYKDLRKEIHNSFTNVSYTVEKLQDLYPFITWRNMLSEMFPNYNVSELNIYIISGTYLKSVSELIPRFQKRVIQNALLAMYARDFLYLITNHTYVTDADNFCTVMTTKALPHAVSALYLDYYSEDYLTDLYNRAEEMFVKLKYSFFTRVEKAMWLDDDSRWMTMDRLTSMTAKLIAWPPLRNASFIDHLMESMDVSNDFFENIMNHYRNKRKIQLEGDELSPFDVIWPFPFVVNAFYVIDENAIVVPLALLTQPHFARGVPEYISYGSIGTVLAHEMMHGLDVMHVGDYVSPLWRNSKSLQALRSKLACVANSYQTMSQKAFNFMGTDIQVQFDGNATLDETTADLSGARVSWGAWKGLEGSADAKSLSPLPLKPPKLFFLSMAQLYCTHLTPEDYIVAVEDDFHLTAPERVNGLVRNTLAFAEAFQCPVGSPMNPATKCSIW